jgi:hypothetical protein
MPWACLVVLFLWTWGQWVHLQWFLPLWLLLHLSRQWVHLQWRLPLWLLLHLPRMILLNKMLWKTRP